MACWFLKDGRRCRSKVDWAWIQQAIAPSGWAKERWGGETFRINLLDFLSFPPLLFYPWTICFFHGCFYMCCSLYLKQERCVLQNFYENITHFTFQIGCLVQGGGWGVFQPVWGLDIVWRWRYRDRLILYFRSKLLSSQLLNRFACYIIRAAFTLLCVLILGSKTFINLPVDLAT